MVRVTVDKDTFDEFREVMTFYNLRHVFGNCSVRWSMNRRGLHFRCFTNLTDDQSVRVREIYGDDEVRTRLDSKLIEKAKNVTFTPLWREWCEDIWSIIPAPIIARPVGNIAKGLNRRRQ